MRKIGLACAILSSFIASSAVADTPAAAAAPNPAAAEASIPFADHDGIYNWQVIDDRNRITDLGSLQIAIAGK